ncbi:hypothetical protein ACN47E_000159 [Coniothyrium glycines]
MFKNEAGEHKFSFTRFMSNAMPNAAGAPQDTDLSEREQDMAFMCQLGEEDPRFLRAHSFLHAGITSAPKVSASIHKALLSNGVLVKDSPTINTAAVSRNFAHQLSNITSHAQKKLIIFLFFWEEELQRWKVLMGEQEELKTVMQAEMDSGGEVGTYEKRLAEVEGMIKLRPSLRPAQVAGNETLPQYVRDKVVHRVPNTHRIRARYQRLYNHRTLRNIFSFVLRPRLRIQDRDVSFVGAV